MTYNTADRKQVKRHEKAAREKAKRKEEVLTFIMSTPAGREWMHDFLADCHIGRQPFTGDNNRTNFQCGEMNVGLRLWADLQTICPDQYTQMMREENERARTRDESADGPREPESTDSDPADESGSI